MEAKKSGVIFAFRCTIRSNSNPLPSLLLSLYSTYIKILATFYHPIASTLAQAILIANLDSLSGLLASFLASFLAPTISFWSFLNKAVLVIFSV